MKNLKRILKSAVAAVVAAVMLLAVVACGNSGTEIRCDKTELGLYGSVKLTAFIDGKEAEFDDADCRVTPEGYARVENGVLKVVAAGEEDVTITVRITIDDKVLKKDFTIRKAPAPGQVSGVRVTLSVDGDRLEEGDEILLTAKVEGANDLTYTYSVSDPDLVEVDSKTGVLKAKDLSSLQFNKFITVTATSNADPDVSDSRQIMLIAPARDGKIGYLTTDAIRALGNASITVNSVMQDHYRNLLNNQESVQNYDGKVMMEEGKWYGAWKSGAENANWMEDSYVRSEADNYFNDSTYTDLYGYTQEVTGHALMQQFVNKNNEVETSPVKNTWSQPAIWEMQHLWNHLNDFANIPMDTKHYSYSPDTPLEYHLKVNDNSIEELYLFTYLSYSFTPLLGDTINDVIFVLNEKGEIESMRLSTEVLYDGGYVSNAAEATESAEWTTVDLTFENVGSTHVPEVKSYSAPQNVEKLDAALAEIKNATSYSYSLTETTVSAPSTDPGDYEMESVSASASAYAGAVALADGKPTYVDRSAYTGTVGQVAWFTPEGILFQNTMQYQYVMEGSPTYRIEYEGYKPFDGYYERFLYNAAEEAYMGVEHIKGDMANVLPKFDFSTALFQYAEYESTNSRYVFKLQESATTRAIAQEVSLHTTAKSGAPLDRQALTITVDGNGHLLEIRYPYSISSGTYIGYSTMRFSGINNTKLPDDNLFNGYIAREVKTSWAQFTTDYQPTHSTQDPKQYTDTLSVMQAIFGEEAANETMVLPTLFTDIIGDNLGGGTGTDSGTMIWFNWRDTEVEGVYKDYLSVTVKYPRGDEQDNIDLELFEEIREEFRTAFAQAGYDYDTANSTAPNARGNRYLCFTKQNASGNGGIEIVIENNGTRNLFISIYKFGDWTLRK